MLSDKECIYPPPVLCKDIMKLQLFKGCRYLEEEASVL